MAKVTTGTGDDGYTSLLGSARVPKYDPRPESFGTVDEATSMLGLARSLCADAEARTLMLHVQRDLYVLMAELATPAEHLDAVNIRITPEHVAWLEAAEQELQTQVAIPNAFVIPGDTPDGAALDVARTIVRRAERMVVKLLHDGVVANNELVIYLNRCSDFLFILARALEVRAGGSTLAATRAADAGHQPPQPAS